MNGDRVSRVWRRNGVGALVVLLVAGGLVLGSSLGAVTTPGAAGAPGSLPILDSGVRFRIVGGAVVNPNTAEFTRTSFVVPNHRAVTISDVVLQNPHADIGMMRVQIGDEVILEDNLSGLRDQLFHIPLHVKADQPVVVAVSCTVPGPPEPLTGRCAPAVGFFG
jgi:hypothetical protein